MFTQTITLFNYLNTKDDYSKTLIDNVEVQPKFITSPDRYGVDNLTKALIIIPYSKDTIGRFILSNNKAKYYLRPKEWNENTSYFTFQNDKDFIIIGDYMNLSDIDLNDIKNSIDDVFIINEVRDYRDDLKHFELIVN